MSLAIFSFTHWQVSFAVAVLELDKDLNFNHLGYFLGL
jgi:hypothetical protein